MEFTGFSENEIGIRLIDGRDILRKYRHVCHQICKLAPSLKWAPNKLLFPTTFFRSVPPVFRLSRPCAASLSLSHTIFVTLSFTHPQSVTPSLSRNIFVTPSFRLAGVALMGLAWVLWRAWVRLKARDAAALLRGRRCTWRHGLAFCVASVAPLGLCWLWSRVTHNFVTHHFGNPTLSHTILHTQLCRTPSFTHTHTPSFTHIFVTHHPEHTTSSTHIFVTPYFVTHTHNFVTHHVSRTSFLHTIFATHPLSHTHTYIHTHTPTHIHTHTTLWHATVSHTIFRTTLSHHLSHTTCYTQLLTYNLLTRRSSTTSFVYPSFPFPLELFVSASWEKLTYGVIRSSMLFNPCNSCRKSKADTRLCLQTHWYTNSVLEVPGESQERGSKRVLKFPNKNIISPLTPRPTQIPIVIRLFARNF